MAFPSYHQGYNGVLHEPAARWQMLGNGYRVYNPALMRFQSPDSLSPFGEGGGNAYAYCEGDPINRLDPDGHFSIHAALFGAAGAALAVGSEQGGGEASNVLSKVAMGLGIAAAAAMGGFLLRKGLSSTARWGRGSSSLQPNIRIRPESVVGKGNGQVFQVGQTQVVRAHGLPAAAWRDGRGISGREFAKQVRPSVQAQSGETAQLHMCFGANLGRASTGQQAATIWKRPVMAMYGKVRNAGSNLTYKTGYQRTFQPLHGWEKRVSVLLHKAAYFPSNYLMRGIWRTGSR